MQKWCQLTWKAWLWIQILEVESECLIQLFCMKVLISCNINFFCVHLNLLVWSVCSFKTFVHSLCIPLLHCDHLPLCISLLALVHCMFDVFRYCTSGWEWWFRRSFILHLAFSEGEYLLVIYVSFACWR